ncbi:MAG: DUF502 domain-containing protein, partial [Planctomycetota bacterium]
MDVRAVRGEYPAGPTERWRLPIECCEAGRSLPDKVLSGKPRPEPSGRNMGGSPGSRADMADSFSSDFKRFFGKGLAILLPTVVTLWILWQAIGFVYTNVAQPINRATRLSVLWVVPQVFEEESLPGWFSVTDEELLTYRDANDVSVDKTADATLRRQIRREYLRAFWNDHWYLNLTGFAIAILLIYLAGVLISNFFGRQIYNRLERLIARIP